MKERKRKKRAKLVSERTEMNMARTKHSNGRKIGVIAIKTRKSS